MICIVGGGASGMMAGIAAARSGGKVLLLERNPRLGKKLLATGNGRCNFTNSEIRLENYHGQDPAFALGALRRFPPHKTLEFFASLGVVPVTEAAGRVFPASNQAGSIVDVLRLELEALGVQVRTEAQVQEIRRGREFTVVLADDEIKAEKVILPQEAKPIPNPVLTARAWSWPKASATGSSPLGLLWYSCSWAKSTLSCRASRFTLKYNFWPAGGRLQAAKGRSSSPTTAFRAFRPWL